MITAAILVIFPLCMAMTAFSDLLTMTIPNRISAILIASFLAIAPFAGLSLYEIATHLAAGGIVFTFCFTLFALGVMGGGDAKILTASAIWFGMTDSLISYVLYVSVFGGLLSLGILLLRANHNILMVSRLPMPETFMHKKRVPYGISIGIAAFMAFPASPLVQAAFGVTAP